MDNRTAGENTDILDVIAGAMQETRFIAAFDPAALVDDTWTFVPLPSAITEMLLELLFNNGEIRFSNLVKVLCVRFRALCNTPGAGGVISLMLRKGGATATAADNLLINPVVLDDSEAAVQNVSGIGRGTPETPIVGGDQGGISLWVMVDAVVSETDMDMEVIVAAQMVPGIPPSIIET